MTTITWICFGLAAVLSVVNAVLAMALMHMRNQLDEERLTVGYLRAVVLEHRRDLADFRFPELTEKEMRLALGQREDP